MNAYHELEILENNIARFSTIIESHGGPTELPLMDCVLQASMYPTFHIPDNLENEIAVGSLVKIIGYWDGMYGERFWVEVTSIHVDRTGKYSYHGVSKNRTFGAAWGSRVGPFHVEHICDLDYDWVPQEM